MIGGIPAGPAGPGRPLAAVVSGLHRRVLDWAAAQSLAPTSVSGISLALGICAAAWFTAGTRPGNLKGALALGAGYLAALGARELVGQAGSRLAATTSSSSSGRLTAAGRSAWLAVLGTRISDSAVYAGLALGAAAEGWGGMWPLAISVLGLVAIRETMTACSGPAHPDLAQDGPVRRAVLTVLMMPAGGRVLLIVVAAPLWGARASLLALLDWAIIAVGYGIGTRTTARRRDRKPADRPRRTLPAGPRRPPTAGPRRPSAARPRRPPAEPSGLNVLLKPARPPARDEFQAARPTGQPIPVLRLDLTPPPPGVGQPADGSAHDGAAYDTAAYDTGASDTAAYDTAAYDGAASSSAAYGSEPGEPGFIESVLSHGVPPANLAAGAPAADSVPADSVPGGSGPGDSVPADGGPADSGAVGLRPAGSGARDGELAEQGPGDDISDDRGLAVVLRCRDDGAISRWFGSLVRGQLMPLPAALLALAGVAMLAHLGLRDLPGFLMLAPAIVMLVAAPGASHRHGGRFDWLVPAVLQGAQYIYIVALGSATGVPAAVTFVLCAAIALRYADLGSAGSPALPARHRGDAAGAAAGPGEGERGERERGEREPGERGAWMGWEGRMTICGLGAAAGIAMFAYLALAAYLIVLVGWKVTTSSPRPAELGLWEGDRR